MHILIAAICFLASFVGAICGVGGGVIIKPLLDALSGYDAAVVSFLSGCTVLSMSAYSTGRTVFNKKLSGAGASKILIAVGGAFGGLLGKSFFNILIESVGNDHMVVTVQSAILFIITAGTLLYTLFKERVTKKSITALPGIVLAGVILGLVSAFLGIGGGPINIVVLSYFFSMDTKEAAESSLQIILLSQVMSLITSVVTGTVPTVDIVLLAMMIIVGVAGGALGRRINDRIAPKSVDVLFMSFLSVIILITAYNFGSNIHIT